MTKMKEEFFSFSVDKIVYFRKMMQQGLANISGTRGSPEDNRYMRSSTRRFFYLFSQIKGWKQLTETKRKTDQFIFVQAGFRQPLAAAVFQTCYQFVKIGQRMYFTGKTLPKEFSGIRFFFGEQQWSKESFTCPAREADLAVELGGDVFCLMKIEMKIVHPVIGLPLQVALQDSQLNGWSVENRPWHGNESNSEWGRGVRAHFIA
jgi:hypothetical protein